MPITALIRNLGNMSSCGLLDDDDNVDIVLSKITNQDILTSGRVHPMTILLAWKTYSAGSGSLGGVGVVGERPSAAVYGQFNQLINPAQTQKFT